MLIRKLQVERFEKEVEKIHHEIVKHSAAVRKSKFDLDIANWEVYKWDQQLKLVNSQLQ